MLLHDINQNMTNDIKQIQTQQDTISKYIQKHGDISSLDEIYNFDVLSIITRGYNVQRKSPILERFLSRKLNWVKLSASLDRGDFLVDGKHIEVKVSYTNLNMCLNLRQLRPWQDIDEYLFMFIDDNNDNHITAFSLTSAEVKEEISIFGGYTHGTKLANTMNQNSEYSLTIKMDNNNQTLQRWKQKYHNSDIISQIKG